VDIQTYGLFDPGLLSSPAERTDSGTRHKESTPTFKTIFANPGCFGSGMPFALLCHHSAQLGDERDHPTGRKCRLSRS